MWPRGPVPRAGRTLGAPPAHLPVAGLSEDAQLVGDVGDRAPLMHDAVDQQLVTMRVGPGVSARHENLRAGVGLRQATAQPEVLVQSTTTGVINVLTEHN